MLGVRGEEVPLQRTSVTSLHPYVFETSLVLSCYRKKLVLATMLNGCRLKINLTTGPFNYFVVSISNFLINLYNWLFFLVNFIINVHAWCTCTILFPTFSFNPVAHTSLVKAMNRITSLEAQQSQVQRSSV